MSSLRSWDLAGGKPEPVHKAGQPRTILLAQSLDPFGSGPGGFVSGATYFDVWGLDRRVAIVERHYFKRSCWFMDRLASGQYDPANELAGTPGEGITGAVQAVCIELLDSGEIRELGPLPGIAWLNGGALTDGTELVSGVSGVRFKFTLEAAGLGTPWTLPAWDLVARVEVKPDGRLGCGDVVAEIVGGISLTPPGAPINLLGNYAG